MRDAALIEVACGIPYGPLTVTSFEQFVLPASHTLYVYCPGAVSTSVYVPGLVGTLAIRTPLRKMSTLGGFAPIHLRFTSFLFGPTLCPLALSTI